VALLGDALDPGRWEPSCSTFSASITSGSARHATTGAGAGAGSSVDAVEHTESPLPAGKTQNAQDVIHASTRLRTEVVPAFARRLEHRFSEHTSGASESLVGAGAGAGAGAGNSVKTEDSSGATSGLPAALAIMKTVSDEAHERGIGVRCVFLCACLSWCLLTNAVE